MSMTVSEDGVRRMVEEVLSGFGMSLKRFIELGRADALDEAELRDLWLIWGSELGSSE